MTTVAPPEHTHCHVALGVDISRCGVVIDYRGDQPPVALFEQLREHGWLTPAPAPPPAAAIDWSTPDPESGRRWSVRPFSVTGAMAVPGPNASASALTREFLVGMLLKLGLQLDSTEEHVGLLTETRPGRADLHVDDDTIDITVPAPSRPMASGPGAMPIVRPAPTAVTGRSRTGRLARRWGRDDHHTAAPVAARPGAAAVVVELPPARAARAVQPAEAVSAGSFDNAPLQWKAPLPA